MKKPKNTEQNVILAVDVIGSYIQKTYGIAASKVQEGNKACWRLRRGSVEFTVELYHDDASEVFFDVISPVVRVPPAGSREALFRFLLEENASRLRLSRFEVISDTIFIRHSRPLKDIDESEIIAAVEEVSGFADDYDNKLHDDFGCKMFGESVAS
jgi:hypothetical protein